MSGIDEGRHGASVRLREACLADSEKIWVWRNNPSTRLASFDSATIPLEAHEAWFRASLWRADRKIFIVVVGGTDAGVVRLDLGGAQSEVSIYLETEWRGRGVGPAALQALADFAFRDIGVKRLVARVKRENRASLAAFLKAGFTVAGEDEVVTVTMSRDDEE